MKKETDTIHYKCPERLRGTIVRDDRISLAQEAMGIRKYTCIDCQQSWAFTNQQEPNHVQPQQ